ESRPTSSTCSNTCSKDRVRHGKSGGYFKSPSADGFLLHQCSGRHALSRHVCPQACLKAVQLHIITNLSMQITSFKLLTSGTTKHLRCLILNGIHKTNAPGGRSWRNSEKITSHQIGWQGAC